MSGKIIIYIIITVLVIWSLDSININSIFKKNKVIQAKVFYFFLALSLIYLVTNFLWDFKNAEFKFWFRRIYGRKWSQQPEIFLIHGPPP